MKRGLGALPGARLLAVAALLIQLCLGAVPLLAAQPEDRYGAPLRFDPPPVDINSEPLAGDGAPPSAAEIAGQPASINAAKGTAQPVGQTGGTPPEKTATVDPVASKSVRLFGTVEFRGPLKNLPKWERVLAAEQKTPTFGVDEKNRMTPDVALRWDALRTKLKNAPLMEQAQAVNNFFNKWPYITDMANWGVEDYWATPSEFIKRSGDCEDYAIAKYYALRNLGVPASQMRIIVVMDTIRNIGHAILAIYMNDNAYILDSLTNLVLVHSRLTHYAPQYSVNEEFRWAHIKPLSGPK